MIAYLSGRRAKGLHLDDIRAAVALLFSAALAGLAVGYASSFITTTPWPVVLGVAWALMIANLDAMVMAKMTERAGIARWVAVGPRVVAVAIAAVLFAKFILMRGFQPEIDEYLARKRLETDTAERGKIEAAYTAATNANNALFGGDIKQHETTLSGLQAQIVTAEEHRRLAGQDAINAIKNRPLYYDQDGHGYFDSAAARAAQAEEQRAAGNVDHVRTAVKPRVDGERSEIDRLRAQQLAEQARIDKRREFDLTALSTVPSSDGLVARIEALGAICSVNPSAWSFRVLLSALLFLLELLPTITKLGDRAEGAAIRERMHHLLREALDSADIKDRLRLWMELHSHRYVDQYLREVDAEVNHGGDVDTMTPADVAPETADDRVRRIIQERKSGANGRHVDPS